MHASFRILTIKKVQDEKFSNCNLFSIFRE